MSKTYQNRKLSIIERIKNTFEKLNLNSEEVNADLIELYSRDDGNYNTLNSKIDSKDVQISTRMTNHTNGTSERHSAEDVDFIPTPTIPSPNTQQAIEKVDERVGNIISSDGTSDAETVDARNSSRYGVFPNLKARLDTHENANMPHLLFNAQDSKYYKYGEQISAEGKPQLIFEEVL